MRPRSENTGEFGLKLTVKVFLCQLANFVHLKCSSAMKLMLDTEALIQRYIEISKRKKKQRETATAYSSS